MGIAFALCVLGRLCLGKTAHPVESDADKVKNDRQEKTKETLDSFAVLTISGHFMAQVAVVGSVCVLPVALNLKELLHCLGVLVIVQFEMVATKVLAALVARRTASESPFASIAREPWYKFSLCSNLVHWYRSHGPFTTIYYVWSVMWYETFVNMVLAGPLERCGWNFALASALVGLSVGLLNHGAVNGVANGVMATPFYVTMAAMFSCSHSVMSVTVAHAVFYFRQLHAAATSAAFGEPLFVLILLVNTAGMYALLAALSSFLAPATELHDVEPSMAFTLSVSSVFAVLSLGADFVRLVVFTVRRIRKQPDAPVTSQVNLVPAPDEEQPPAGLSNALAPLRDLQ